MNYDLMVTLRFTKMEVQEIKLWGNYYKKNQEENGVRWEEQQEKILTKLSIPPQAKASGILEATL